jgi:hypothetical protein
LYVRPPSKNNGFVNIYSFSLESGDETQIRYVATLKRKAFSFLKSIVLLRYKITKKHIAQEWRPSQMTECHHSQAKCLFSVPQGPLEPKGWIVLHKVEDRGLGLSISVDRQALGSTAWLGPSAILRLVCLGVGSCRSVQP